MHADPDEARLVAHQVDIVVARADGAELGHRLLAIGLHVGLAPRIGVVEQRVLGTLLVGAADAERDRPRHVPDDRADAVGDRRVGRVEANRHVAAADVEADAGNADLLLIGDDAADRLRIAEMAVGADDAADDIADRHAVLHLRDGRGIVLGRTP